MLRAATISGLLVLAAACATTDATPAVPAQPLMANYRSEVERVIAMNLRDPSSAIFDHRLAPYRLTCERRVLSEVKQEFWAAEVWVNARNGFGGYTGPQPYTVIFVPKADGTVELKGTTGQLGGLLASPGFCRPASIEAAS